MKAARTVKLNQTLQIQDLQTPRPKGSQILIKIQSAGVCHSDVHVWEGYYEGIDGQQLKTTDRGAKYPLTPDHEIAGIVDGLGDESEGFNKNDKVLVYPWIGDGVFEIVFVVIAVVGFGLLTYEFAGRVDKSHDFYPK